MKIVHTLLVDFVLLLCLILVPLFCVIGWLTRLPENFWLFQKSGFIQFITACPEDIRLIIKMFDANGLRHNIQHLNLTRVRNKVAVMPVEQQCDYVDAVTFQSFPKDTSKIKVRPAPIAIITGPVMPDMGMFYQINISSINTTGIGNLAWMSLYHPDEEQRQKATEKLNEIREYYKQFV